MRSAGVALLHRASARTVLADLDELVEFGLDPSEEALAEANSAERCAMCGAPPIEPQWREGQLIAWFDQYAPETALAARAALAQQVAPSERVWPALSWRHDLQTLRWDSQLAPTFAAPPDVLERIAPQLDPDTVDFLRSRLVFAVCGRCRATDLPEAHVGPTLERLYVAVHFDGNLAAAERQPSWAFVERLVAEIERAALPARDETPLVS